MHEDANEKNTGFDFQLVMPDKFSMRYLSRDIGTTVTGKKGSDDEKTLEQCKFVVLFSFTIEFRNITFI